MIEPGMAVREGEQGAVQSSQNIPDAWRGQLKSALSGKSGLGDDVREGIKNLASRAYNSHKGLYDQAFDMYTKEAEFQGLPTDRLSYIGKAKEAKDIFTPTINPTQKNDIAALAAQARAEGIDLAAAVQAEKNRRMAARGQ
jgi:hypothetical protein